MKMSEKLKYVVRNNPVATVVLIIALVMFLYTTNLHIIEGALITISALVAGVCVTLLYKAYSAVPASAPKAKRKK